MSEQLGDNNLYLQVRQDGSYGLNADGPTGPVNLNLTYRNPGIRFALGGKHVTFQLTDDGRIDVEYNAEDLTDAAQVMISEVKRLLRQTDDE